MEQVNNFNKAKQDSRGRIFSLVIAGIGLAIMLFLIGGGALLASHVWNPTWNPFKPNSDKTIREKIFYQIKK